MNEPAAYIPDLDAHTQAHTKTVNGVRSQSLYDSTTIAHISAGSDSGLKRE